MSEIGLGFDWPAWLQVHIKNATTPDRQRWVAFAMAIETENVRGRIDARNHPNDPNKQARAKLMAEYAQPNGVNTRPDDPFWSSTPERKSFRDAMLHNSAKTKFTLETKFDPGKVISDIENAISKIPVVGDVAHVVAEVYTAPFKIAADIVKGERLDHVAIDALKNQVKIAKDEAPYVQAVVSIVPGIGTGAAAAMGAGVALAEGKSITDAGKAAIRAAIPGGPVAAAGFDAGMKIAAGENVGKAALESARNLVPAGPAQKAFDIGIAVATGEKLQNAVAKGVTSLAPDALQAVIGAGQKAIASTPGLSSVIHGLDAEATRGAELAAGLLSHSGMNEKAVSAFRNKLTAAAKKGFDVALNAQAQHLPWLSNITGTPVPHAAEPRGAPHAVEPTKAVPHAAEPPKAVPHALEPPKPHELPAHAAVPPASSSPQGATLGPYPTPWPIQVGTHGVDAPPHPHLPHGHHGGHPLNRGGPRWGGGAPWWAVPYIPEQVVTVTACHTWGAPIEMPPAMVNAARVALGASQGQPTTIRGPDGALYLFAFENGVLTARPCAS